MDKAPEDFETLPPGLQWLKRLVIGLTGVMILGFLVLIAALVIRLNAAPLPLPDRISLPEGGKSAGLYPRNRLVCRSHRRQHHPDL